MTKLTTTLSKFASCLQLAGFGAVMLLAGCDQASDVDGLDGTEGTEGDEDVGELDELSQVAAEYDGFELVPVEAEQLLDMGVAEIGDAWVDDCNLCTLTPNGPACTIKACDDADSEQPLDIEKTCEDGAYVEGEMWMKSCNVCTCTFEGTICTKKACDPDDLPH